MISALRENNSSSVLTHTDHEEVAGITLHQQEKQGHIRIDRTGTQRQD